MVAGQLMVPVEETTGEALPEDRSAVSSLPEEAEAPEARGCSAAGLLSAEDPCSGPAIRA